MKTQKRQVTITDLYNLVAHETVSLLEAVDDDAIPPALEMRKGLTMLAATAGTGEGVETHLEWIDQEIENLKPVSYTHLDVYKRQAPSSPGPRSTMCPPWSCASTAAPFPPALRRNTGVILRRCGTALPK